MSEKPDITILVDDKVVFGVPPRPEPEETNLWSRAYGRDFDRARLGSDPFAPQTEPERRCQDALYQNSPLTRRMTP